MGTITYTVGHDQIRYYRMCMTHDNAETGDPVKMVLVEERCEEIEKEAPIYELTKKKIFN